MAIACPECHYENAGDSRFCGKCATSLQTAVTDISARKETYSSAKKELTSGSNFAGRYQVIEELGKGGMGRVYRVVDTKIDEEVALKLIKPEIVDKKTLERFSNELKLARKISHRNVCRMFHLGEENGTNYITMEYVRGESLKDIIKMMGQLSPSQAVFIAKQACEGLAEAHRLGIVHRDLKPSNIMVDRAGNVRIMDFGIARSLDTKGITRAGAMIGTPEYMSPEQVDGKEADRRSDIYSLGIILYEMVTGQVPFQGDNSLMIAFKHKSEEPQNPRKLNPQIPEELSRVILKCIEKDKEKRFLGTEDLSSELSEIEEGMSTTRLVISEKKSTVLNQVNKTFRKHWVTVASFFLILVVIGISIVYSVNNKKPAFFPGQKMLVVLPFHNLGPPEDEYFADGITDEITSRLASLSGIGVISRTSAIQFKDTNKTTKQIGEDLGTDYILEGSVRWNRSPAGKGRVRVNPQLIRVSDDTNLWSETYEEVIEDIFSVQSKIAEQVARELDLTVLEPERRALNVKPTNNLEAYDLFLQARNHEMRGWSSSDNQEFERSIELLDKATQLDPEFALAYINKSILHSRMYFFGIDRTEQRLAKSRKAVDKALALQPDLPDAQMALAFYYYWGLLDYDRAVEIFKSVQKARPNFSPELLGYVERRKGKWEQALEKLKKAFKLSPRFPQLAYEIGLTYLGLRQYKQAVEWFDRTLSIESGHFAAQLGKVTAAFLSQGNTREARILLKTLPPHRLSDYTWFVLDMFDKKYQEALKRLDSMPYDSFKEQHFYFEKNLAYAFIYHAKKDIRLMRKHAELALIALEKAVGEYPKDPRYHAALGQALAYLGREEEAIQEGNRAAEIYPAFKDAANGPVYVLNLARIYTVVGEDDRAIEQLEYLVSISSSEFIWQIVTVACLRTDPQWESLRKHKRFQLLLQREK